MSKFFSTEQVSKWHPDKYADQISDAIVTAYLKEDRDAHVAVETLVKGDVVVIAGEVYSALSSPDWEEIRRNAVYKVADKLGYKVGEIIDLVSTQSPEINRAVTEPEKIGAGDQGTMFGYAERGTESKLPFGFDIANQIIELIENETEFSDRKIFKGDAKCQVTINTEKGLVEKVLISVCHDAKFTIQEVREYIATLLSLHFGLTESNCELIINPSGAWTIGGPEADCGLTGRKIVCDQYGGFTPVGGGAFSGKDPTKVDRSGAYMARKIACDVIDRFEEVNNVTIQLAYAIGMPEPMSVIAVTDKPELDDDITGWILDNYDLTPAGIIKTLNLKDINYEKVAEGCHYRPGSSLFGD